MIDPITFAVVRNKLIFIAKGMLDTASSCGVTSFMGEVRDCSFAILDAYADVIAQSDGILLFLGSLSPATKNCIDFIGKKNIKHGDIVISTLPDVTGSHTSDAMLFSPIYYAGKLFGYASTKAHWQDLGAKTTYPTDAKNIYEEGLRIPPVKLFQRGELQSEILAIIKSNSRAPEQVWGDIQAQIAGCHFAEKQVIELLDKYGVETIKDCIQEMYVYSERITRLAIEKMPDGTWTAEDFIDDNGIDLDKPIPIKVAITIKGSDITLDFSGSAHEQNGPMNGLWVTTLSAARVAVKALTTPKLPANEGFNKPITVIAPKGCVYNAGPSAPSFLCGNVASTILELVNKALWEVVPDKIPACSGGDVCGGGYFGIDPRTGKQWATLSSPRIGQGGDCFSDGDSFSGHHSVGGGGIISLEMLELLYPLLAERCELIQDSGGAGKQRGGLGMKLKILLTESATMFRFIEKAKAPHWGVDGGKEGLRNYAIVKPEHREVFEVLKSSGLHLTKGDRVIAIGGGGGGYGKPFKRKAEAVRWDVINGCVSIEAAVRDYGVVLNPETYDVDTVTTEKLRSSLLKT
jgi:N-methylhydantoinase B